MARSKNTLKVTFEDFSGMDLRKTHTGKISCADMTNFRIMPDGSIRKRCGFKTVYTADKNIRGVWSGMLDGEFVYIAVIYSNVYNVNFETKTAKTIGYLLSIDTPVSFFFYCGKLYLRDSSGIYSVTPSSASKSEGYVPLYGKDWPTSFYGEINEPLNILNTKARISYKVTANNTVMLPTKLKVTQVYALYKNGTLLSSSEYKIDSNLNTINVNSVKEGDEFLAVVQIGISEPEINELKRKFTHATSSKVYSDIKSSRAFWWGDSLGNLIFTSTTPSPENYAESEKYFPGQGPLYVAFGSEFILGDGKNEVKAMLTHYDRLLIFSDGDVWMVDSSILADQNAPMKAINSIAGSSVSGGVTMAGNDPISVGKHTVFRWTSDTDEFNQCNAYSISEAINSKLTQSFFDNAIVFNDVYKNELWFHDPLGDGTVWIYNVNKKYWYKYSGINAKFFFDANGKVGFSDGTSLFVFSDELEYDYDASDNAREIVATLESGIIDFESSDRKRILSIDSVGDIKDGSLQIDITLDTGESVHTVLSGSGAHGISKQKLSSGRFSSLKMFITSRGTTDEAIHSISLTANKKTR